MHTSEFWLILTVPVLLTMSFAKQLNLSSIILFGIITALPIFKNGNVIIEKSFFSEKKIKSETETSHGLSSSKLSKIINLAENDSKNPQDILFYLPEEGVGDFTLRTKMRTMELHFAGRSFENCSEFKSPEKLNVYIAYNKSLLKDENFKRSLKTKFPQASSSKMISDEYISLLKVTLSPEFTSSKLDGKLHI